jgi:hypothetical protein
MVLNVQSTTSFLSKYRTELVHIVLLKGLGDIGMEGNVVQVDLSGSFVFTTSLYAELKLCIHELGLHGVEFLLCWYIRARSICRGDFSPFKC